MVVVYECAILLSILTCYIEHTLPPEVLENLYWILLEEFIVWFR